MGMSNWHRHSAHILKSERWRRVRVEVLNRDNWQCVQCGARGSLEVDHITPVRKGGAEYDLGNLQSLCKRCHSVKTQSEVFKNGKPDPEAMKWRRLLRCELE